MLSLESFSRLIAKIHGSALDPGGWASIVGAITSEIGGTIGGFVMDDRKRGITIAISTADAAAARSYRQYYGRIDPILPSLATFDAGTVVHDSMIMPMAEIHRTEFYNDWVKPQGVAGCVGVPLSIGQTFSAFLLGSLSGQGSEDRAEIYSSLLQHLVPHLQVALRVARFTDAVADESNLWHILLDRLERPIFLMAGDGRLVHANAPAARLLREQDGLRSMRGFLEASMRRETTAVRNIISKAAAPDMPRGGSCAVTRPSGRGRLVLTATPIRSEQGPKGNARFAVALLVSGDSRPSSGIQKLLIDIYELTPAEARLAQIIAKGVGVQEAAQTLSISPSTARTHLLRIFQKTGIRRQAELAHVATELAPL